MDDRTLELSLSPFALESAAEIESVRLLALADRPHLVTSATAATGGASTRYSSTPLHGERSSSVLADIPQLLAVPPRWDIASGDRGGSAIVYEVAGGAMNALFLARPSSDEPGGEPAAWLTAHHPRESFGHPRFFKGRRGGDLALSAIVENTRAVAFLGPPGGAYTPLIEAAEALVVRCGSGLVLIYKRTRPGPVRGSDIFRGVLRCVRLGDGLRPRGSVLAPFGDTTVFELDADVHGDEVVIFATLEAGVALALLRAEGEGLAVVARRSVRHAAELIRPAILAAGGELHVAVVEAAVVQEAERVWTGSVTVEARS